ncbi:MAG: pyridoxal-phosphate dependent enzyme [Crocinitomicaceae bacterium]|nr:pyridoxal-phosphate dependent enzyme [Crocinitomicaceae bacterium]
MIDIRKSLLQEINLKHLIARDIKLYIKRDDLLHSEISGNKWRKLKYNVELCLVKKKNGLLTFGGAYSNHLLATAAACNLFGLKSIGIVRGEELNENSNSTLFRCQELGMELVFVSRAEYQLKNEKEYQDEILANNPSFQLVPEGGANYYGVIGCQEIMKEVPNEVDHIFVSQGTATTSCGVLLSLKEKQKLHVVPALKGFDSIGEVNGLLSRTGIDKGLTDSLIKQIVVHDGCHFGGYGKYTNELLTFIQDFFQETKLKLDPIYTGKTMFGMLKELEKDCYNGQSILFIHTGGLQGVEGIEKKSGIKLFED